MKDWDDFYQDMVAKGKRPEIKSAMKTYKNETDAFYKDWRQAEANGVLNNPNYWDNESDDE